MHKLQKSTIQIAALILTAGGISASIYLAGNGVKDSVYVCAAERKWFPLHPRVIHAKDCSNTWIIKTAGILMASTGIAIITFAVHQRTKKHDGNTSNMLNIKIGNSRHEACTETRTASLEGNNYPKIRVVATVNDNPDKPVGNITGKASLMRIVCGGIALVATGFYLAPLILYKSLDRINANNAIADSKTRVEGYWLDQYNASLYLLAHALDDELREMKAQGAKLVLIHADSLPLMILEKMANDANREGLKVIAWIQKPNKENLLRAGKLENYDGVQIDDHFFASPPITLTDLRRQIGKKQLWCSFQPKQYTSYAAKQCDHIDVQIYRNSCLSTLYTAESFGLINKSNAAIAVYDDGSLEGRRETYCILRGLASMNGRSLVFKWNNQEVWTKPIWQLVGKVVRPRS